MVREITRREFFTLSAAGTAALLTGCATNPVTGRRQLMLVSRAEEIRVDRENSPHQFSADYGMLQDTELNWYITSVGEALASRSHRPNMPYSFRGINAVHVNAYAFPGGSIATTRGMLVNMESEAELAAVLGHEIGHVCSRHTAQQMTTSLLTTAVVATATAYVGSQYEEYEALTAGLGMIATGALLARYSRENEREADALGLDYMTRSGYNPDGFINVMDMLRKLSSNKPNIIELMFATHPMSEERYQTAVEAVRTEFRSAAEYPLNRDRYMDRTAQLRAIKGAIAQMQNGQKAMSEKKLDLAMSYLQTALKEVPHDYACLLMLAKCRLAQKRYAEANRYAEEAKTVYPREAQAYQAAGMAKVYNRRPDAAYEDFCHYEQLLPGNPNTVFFKGFALEGMGRRSEASQQYFAFLNQVRKGEYAAHAYKRLVEWGYIIPQQG